MPNIKFKEFLRKVTTEDIVNKMSEAKHACPKSVGDVAVTYTHLTLPTTPYV